VIFPEAPGSFAETGYFSAIGKLSKRCILVLDLAYQHKDSFISLGPATKIGGCSIFQPIIQINYQTPDFTSVAERIRRIQHSKYKKSLKLESFKNLAAYDQFCLTHEIVRLLTIATIDDILFIFRGIFGGRIAPNSVKRVVSVLIGIKYLSYVGNFGHMHINPEKPRLLYVIDGYMEREREIRLCIATLHQNSEKEFADIVEASRDVN